MTRFRSWLIVAALLIVANGSRYSFGAPRLQGSVQIGLKTERSTYVRNAPIHVLLSIQNNSGEPIEFDLGRDSKSALGFSITPPDGRMVEAPYPVPAEGISIRSLETLAPGERYTQRLLLDEWYDFPSSGVYTVELKTDALFHTVAGRNLPPQKNQNVLVEVGPPDALRLALVCSDLAEEAIVGLSVSERVNAAVALSYVEDSVATPFLRRVLEQGQSVKEIVVKALGRIGSIEAAEALIASLTRSDEELKRLIVLELRGIESVSVNQQLKSRIRLAL